MSPDEPDDIDAIVAALRADTTDLNIYARVLTTSLADALPSGMVTIDRNRSLADRVAGREGRVEAIRISINDWEFTLTPVHGVMTARARQKVRGIAISNRDVTIEEWIRLLATALAERAQRSADGRAALAKLLGQSDDRTP